MLPDRPYEIIVFEKSIWKDAYDFFCIFFMAALLLVLARRKENKATHLLVDE